MAKLTGKIGEWELDHVHMWKDRKEPIRFQPVPLITSASRIAVIGNCFAGELAHGLARLGVNGALHPGGFLYNSRSIRQEVERIFGGWPEYDEEPYWQAQQGFVHPFKNYKQVLPTEDALRAWSDEIDRQARELLQSADIFVIILGIIEAWMQPRTGNYYRQIPHPDAFDEVGAVFRRLTVAEMMEDLSRIRSVLRQNTDPEIILAVSPTPLQATVTPFDVRVANSESQGRMRAAVSELVECFPDVHYFHANEMVTTAERMSDFMKEDGRHVHPRGMDYVIQQFLMMFGREGLPVPKVDASWLTAPDKVAARPRRTLLKRLSQRTARILARSSKDLPGQSISPGQ